MICLLAIVGGLWLLSFLVQVVTACFEADHISLPSEPYVEKPVSMPNAKCECCGKHHYYLAECDWE